MTQRNQQVEEIFSAALALQPAARDDFLRAACAGDDGLRQELAELLAQQPGPDFLRPPPYSLLLPQQPDFGPLSVIEPLPGPGRCWLCRDAEDHLLQVEIFAGDIANRTLGRFAATAYGGSQLGLPGLQQVRRHGRLADGAYIACDYIAGKPLPLGLSAEEASTSDAACWLRWLQRLAALLAGLHAQGYAHGSLLPERMTIAADGEVWLSGLGLATLQGRTPTPHEDTLQLLQLLATLLPQLPRQLLLARQLAAVHSRGIRRRALDSAWLADALRRLSPDQPTAGSGNWLQRWLRRG